MSSSIEPSASERVRRIVQAAELFSNLDRTTVIVRLLEAGGPLPASSVWPKRVSNSSRSKHVADHLEPFVRREQLARNRDSNYQVREEVRGALQRAADALDYLVHAVSSADREVRVAMRDGDFLVDGQRTDARMLAAIIKQALEEARISPPASKELQAHKSENEL